MRAAWVSIRPLRGLLDHRKAAGCASGEGAARVRAERRRARWRAGGVGKKGEKKRDGEFGGNLGDLLYFLFGLW
ncbi:hypothetical protein GCM10009532_14430 [Microbacterium aurantiacum]